jgi:hypothetical protein
MMQHRLHTGDRVQVRSAQEILATLDDDGTLDALPFLPEMLDSCGKVFSILRRVHKTCVDGHPMRRFSSDDVVILDGSRCDGNGHDGCRHGCRIFWKEAWLRPAADASVATPAHDGIDALRARLKVKVDANHYFCQSTQLLKATEAFAEEPRLLWLKVALGAVKTGDVPIKEFLRLLARLVVQRLKRATGAEDRLKGSNKQTPTEALNLKPGELVRIKSPEQIVTTLDENSRNRGLSICPEMSRCCGEVAEVRWRVDRFIDERSGLMREFANTVALQNLRRDNRLVEECQCQGQLGDCPRGELMYWREIWLERAG